METAKVLLPLVNVPMIDYTLEWLSRNGVKEVGLAPNLYQPWKFVLKPDGRSTEDVFNRGNHLLSAGVCVLLCSC